uniref:AMPK1_CBM domain-containing protein n=1 Tax=Loa loa TaxID=7209 RepID=A0A1I7VJJ5_LOALO
MNCVPMEEKKPSVDVGEVFTDAAQALGAKSPVFQKRSRSSGLSNIRPYDGPLASTSLAWDVKESHCNSMLAFITVDDVESEPIEHLVTVYHSGRSDEFVPMEEKKPSVDVGPYDGPLASTSLAWDVEGEPLQQHVSVYHSGRSDEPMTKIVEIPTEISLEEVPVVEKPTDVESEPIEHLVTSIIVVVPMNLYDGEKKPSVDVGEVFTDAAQALGAKITGLFKRGPLIWIIQHQAHMMDRWLQQALHGCGRRAIATAC